MTEPTDRKTAILDAMLDLVTERGLHDAPMSALAKMSAASPGVIYHYFPGKDEIIRALYLRTSAEKRDAMLSGVEIGMDPKSAFMRIWRNAYLFHRQQPKRTQFLNQYVNSAYWSADTKGVLKNADDPLAAWVAAMGKPRASGGILNDLPAEAVEALSFGSAAALARAEQSFDEATLTRVAEASWRAIAEVETGA